MKTTQYVSLYVFPAAFALLPAHMGTREAKAMILAIFLQESRMRNRVQIKGPANGFGQFEEGNAKSRAGVYGVLHHPTTRPILLPILDTMRFEPDAHACYRALEHNDILMVVFSRLLLWTSPMALPGPNNAAAGWRLYTSAWRPGKPHPETWDAFFTQAWQITMEA